MGIFFLCFIVYTLLIDGIDPYFAMGMDDPVGAQHDPGVYDRTLVIIEKGQIPGFCIHDKVQYPAMIHLLVAVAGQLKAAYTHDNLGEPGTIDAKNGLPSPKIRGIQIVACNGFQCFPGI